MHDSLDRLLYRLSTYALPVFIGLLSLISLFAWQSQYPLTNPKPISFRVIAQTGSLLGPEQASAQLENRPFVSLHDTRLSEAPVWISFQTRHEEAGSPQMVEFPSRHAVDITCWDSKTLQLLGHSTRQEASGDISNVKAGFALALSHPREDRQVLCRASFIGPARLSILQWSTQQLQVSALEFHRNAGLLDGGLIVLALFVLITALINRNSTYLLFSAWLLVNLRMAALSAGWDFQWLGQTVPPDWLMLGRPVTIALYYLLTLTLFKTLFKDDLGRIGYASLVRAAQWVSLLLLLLSVTLPYAYFLPLVWVATGLGEGMLFFLLTRSLFKTNSRVAIWYGASLAITLSASFYEVLAAALGLKGLIGTVNSVSAALSSSLLASLAIAIQMRQEHQQRLQAQAELQHTYEAMPIGLFTLNMQGRFTSANPALHCMLGANVLEVGSNSWQQYFNEGAWTRLHQMVSTQLDGELEIEGNNRQGATEPRRFMVKATLANDKIEGSLQDVTEKSRATENLHFLANNDSLTKILNRRGIEKAFDSAMLELAEGKPLAMAYLDLDRFKLINDLFGHSTGDEVLQQVCERVNSLLSGELKMGRVGGDEFLIVMPNTKIALATLICQGVIADIGGEAFQVGERAFHVRGSIGLIEVSPGMLMKDAISAADRACREAKVGPSDSLVVYERNALVFREHEAELQLIERFSTHAAMDGLYLEMQPIMSLTAPHESLNFEVLLRMRDDKGHVIPTERLIAAGENSGRMSAIDRWVLSTTLDWLYHNQSRLAHINFVCMNLSGASLNDEKFIDDVVAMLEHHKLLAKRLCLEITESVALHDLNNTRRFIDKVRSYGAKVALDDFGAGYTSFSYLKDLPADLIKIDGSFIVNMNSHPANVAIVEAIVSLARNLGMKTVAEWAEDHATVQTLAEIGVDYVQGYVVARPQEPSELLTAVSSASFIQDEQLAQFVQLLGQTDDTRIQVDLFAQLDKENMH
jgi:diguanylate cyclase (GGDEF)-like protein/PAS domain S-box-containing protein